VRKTGQNSSSQLREIDLDLTPDPRGSGGECVVFVEAKATAGNAAPRCYQDRCLRNAVRVTSGMLNMLTAPALTLMFLIVVIALGAAFVWMFWEIEQTMSRLRRMSGPHRRGNRLG
jgi:hypothetical protein